MSRRCHGVIRKTRKVIRNGRKAVTTAMRVRDITILVGVPLTGLIGYATAVTANLPAEVTQNVTQLSLVAGAIALGILFLR